MCGITGFWDFSHRLTIEEADAAIRNMSDRLRHRGPDDEGWWANVADGIHLGHRRLSIIDLSPQGHQPMLSSDGRYVIVFNGEIYNFLELRAALESRGHRFRGHSDTEVMLASFTEWGITDAVTRFNGMFAFAVWDQREHTLYLVRDRLGEKPLYYGWVNGTFFFSSEIKALYVHPDFHAKIDRAALALYLCHLYVPAPHSIYEGISKLLPGCVLKVCDPNSALVPAPYWSLYETAKRGYEQPFQGTEEDAVTQLDELLLDAVRMRLIADVPVGAFLSGGLDSSLIVSLMQKVSERPVKTFSIGVHDDAYNEAEYAKHVARHLGTEHTELYVTPEDALGVIHLLPTIYDEPFCDSSQIPTFLVSRLARQHVKVSLSGDGGDELFCGYQRYWQTPDAWKKIGWMPHSLRSVLSRSLKSISPHHWNRVGDVISPTSSLKLGDKLHKFASLLLAKDDDHLYRYMISLFWYWNDASVVLGQGTNSLAQLEPHYPALSSLDFVQRMMYFDATFFLPDDILVKLDRASMSVSLESRVPLLDHRVVEFAWRLPLAMKIRNGESKWLLRQLLYRYVPRDLVERPKRGFGIPIATWLRGPLREWAESLLSEQRLMREGIFNPKPIRKKWDEFIGGERNWHYDLWAILMFEAWLEQRAV